MARVRHYDGRPEDIEDPEGRVTRQLATGPLGVNFRASSGQFVLTAVLLSKSTMLRLAGEQKRHYAPLGISIPFFGGRV